MLRSSLKWCAVAEQATFPIPKILLNPGGKTDLPELPTTSTITGKELKELYYKAHYIRRMESLSDVTYKQRKIRGFCHLFTGQEAIALGCESVLDYNDAIVTAYRCHGWHVTRGGNAFEVFCEMFGKATGCSKGKGGSMHLYKAENKFFGGNGIVGAQVPIGLGLGFKYWYESKDNKPAHVSVALYGDGAANQGQVFEAFNMAALWKIPCIFICENNRFGMGTSANRHAANPNFYQRCEYIPGIKIDGMDVLAVREGMKWAKDYALAGHGPVVIEMDSYRYMGHSMSDPGTTYRSRDDVKHVRDERDCIMKMTKYIVGSNLATEEELAKLEADAKKTVDAELVRAEAAPEAKLEELTTDVYSHDNVHVRGKAGTEWLR